MKIQVATYFGFSPEFVTDSDLDVRDERDVFLSFDEETGRAALGERDVQMDDSSREFRTVIGLPAARRQYDWFFLFSWQLVDAVARNACSGALKWIDSVRSWASRESELRAATTIRLLFSYLLLFGAGSSAGGDGGDRNSKLNSVFSRTRSRHDVFTFARRVFCVPGLQLPVSSRRGLFPFSGPPATVCIF